jgi:hypothetical protein
MARFWPSGDLKLSAALGLPTLTFASCSAPQYSRWERHIGMSNSSRLVRDPQSIPGNRTHYSGGPCALAFHNDGCLAIPAVIEKLGLDGLARGRPSARGLSEPSRSGCNSLLDHTSYARRAHLRQKMQL